MVDLSPAALPAQSSLHGPAMRRDLGIALIVIAAALLIGAAIIVADRVATAARQAHDRERALQALAESIRDRVLRRDHGFFTAMLVGHRALDACPPALRESYAQAHRPIIAAIASHGFTSASPALVLIGDR